MAYKTGLRLPSLILALSSLTLQTPVTHVVTKTKTAGELGATMLPSGTGHIVSPIIEINVPPIPMAPSSTVTITTTFTIDDPNIYTLSSVGATCIAMLLIPLLCSLAIVAYRRGYRAKLFKEPVEAAAPKAKPKQPSSESKPTGRPRSGSQPQPQPKPKPPTEEELRQKEKELKERQDELRRERETRHWETTFVDFDDMVTVVPEPESPIRYQPRSQTPAPAPKKNVTFAEPPGGHDVRPRSNQGSNRTSLKGSRATFNIY